MEMSMTAILRRTRRCPWRRWRKPLCRARVAVPASTCMPPRPDRWAWNASCWPMASRAKRSCTWKCPATMARCASTTTTSYPENTMTASISEIQQRICDKFGLPAAATRSQAARTEQAIAVFQLGVQLYPQGANGHRTRRTARRRKPSRITAVRWNWTRVTCMAWRVCACWVPTSEPSCRVRPHARPGRPPGSRRRCPGRARLPL